MVNLIELISVRNVLNKQWIIKNIINRATLTDFTNYLLEDILVKVDRASMLSSLEIRAPFLDYSIIEFAYNKVPPYLKTTLNDKKILSKLLCKKLLPDGFDYQRKQRFSIPLSSWLEGDEWNNYFKNVLLDSDGTV